MTFDIDNLVIIVDKDVPRTRKTARKVDLDNDERVKKLKAMEIGDSFFLAGVERKNTRGVINLGKKAGVFLLPRYCEVDEIAQVAGTRIWRVEENEMSGRGKPGVVPPSNADVIRYWHHPESSCVFMTGGVHGKHPTAEDYDPLCEEIDKATYDELRLKYDDDDF